MPSRALLTLVVLLLSAAPAAAAVHKNPKIEKSPLLWATINVCDTPSHPNTIGLRGSMPGTGRDEVMYMRFQVQFWSRADEHWHSVAQGGDSGYVRVGSAQYKVRRAGWSFPFQPPSGTTYVMRGGISFEWRRNGKAVYRTFRRTQSGHSTAPGSDPKGYSAGRCEIKPDS